MAGHPRWSCPGLDAELLVLRHENAVLRRNIGRMQYEPADRVIHRTGPAPPPQRWTKIFPITPATLLAWQQKLAAKKYDTSKRRKPGRPPTAASIGITENVRHQANQ